MLTAMFGMLEAPGSLFGGMMQRRGHQLAKKQITLVECGQEVSEPDSGAGRDGTGRDGVSFPGQRLSTAEALGSSVLA